jgi:hypothetical protein
VGLSHKHTACIDESGLFDGSERSVVASVVCSNDARRIADTSLRARLEAIAPWVPWPLHAAHVRSPAMHAAWLASAPGRCCPGALVESVAQLRARLADEAWCKSARIGESDRSAFVATLGGEQNPDLDGLRRLWRRVRVARETRRAAAHVEGATRQVTAAIELALLAWSTDAACVVFSAETWESAGDPYLDALADLLDRHLLSAVCGDGAQPWLRIQRRRVRLMDGSRSTPISQGVVGRLLSERVRPRVGRAAAAVPLPVEAIIDFWADAEACDVAADWIANVLRHQGATERELRAWARSGIESIRAGASVCPLARTLPPATVDEMTALYAQTASGGAA